MKVFNHIMKGKSKSKCSIKSKLQKTSDIGLSNPKNFEELKDLQFRLEDLLVSTTKKKCALEKRISSLESLNSNFQDIGKKEKRSRSTDFVEKKNNDEKPPKKVKESSKGYPPTTSQAKSKIILPSFTESYLDAPKVQKSDGPNRFWAFLEPYCSDITQDTINAIESVISPQDSIDKYLEIPKLGTHFSKKWPLEDVKEDMREGSKSLENQKGLFTDSTSNQEDGERILQLAENIRLSVYEEKHSSVTERLVYTLVEENLMTSLDETMTEVCEEFQDTKINISHVESVAKEESIENRMWKDFYENGLIDSMDSATSNNIHDEVYQELIHLQSILVPVNEYNTRKKKKLLVLAKAEMEKREVKKKLQEMDAKVMETYRTISAARKSECMNKKLEDQVKRILRERRNLLEKLNCMT